jgi:hypothetical protein
MFRFSFFGWFKSRQQPSRASRRRCRRSNPALPPRRTALRVEALEDRTLPSTFTVLNLADSGPGSLRQAVLDANANPGSTIDFAPKLHGPAANCSSPTA